MAPSASDESKSMASHQQPIVESQGAVGKMEQKTYFDMGLPSFVDVPVTSNGIDCVSFLAATETLLKMLGAFSTLENNNNNRNLLTFYFISIYRYCRGYRFHAN
jgi:hypothetical protein